MAAPAGTAGPAHAWMLAAAVGLSLWVAAGFAARLFLPEGVRAVFAAGTAVVAAFVCLQAMRTWGLAR